MDTSFYSDKELEQTRADLTTAREKYAKAKILYQSLDDKRRLLIDKITYQIAEKQSVAVNKAKGMILDNKEYQEFKEGYESAREKYEKWRVQKDNLETFWETIRTILAENRKDRYNEVKK